MECNIKKKENILILIKFLVQLLSLGDHNTKLLVAVGKSRVVAGQ